MKNLFALSILALAVTFGLQPDARAATLFRHPGILVTPGEIDFGRVWTNSTATNSFLVENVGGGTLTGVATTQPPFKIVQGEAYSLGPSQAQVVTIVYQPALGGATTAVQKVVFTGGGGAIATAKGTPSAKPPPRKRKG